MLYLGIYTQKICKSVPVYTLIGVLCKLLGLFFLFFLQDAQGFFVQGRFLLSVV